MPRQLFRLLMCSVLAISVLSTVSVSASEISSYAFINEDATLRIKRKTIHLYGIHIPKTTRNCRTNVSPVVCGSRAALALEFIVQGFVRCELIEKKSDGSYIGWCRVNYVEWLVPSDLRQKLVLDHLC